MLNAHPIELIIFEWDGTLFNSIAPVTALIELAKQPDCMLEDAVILRDSGLIAILDQIVNDEHAFHINDLKLIMDMAGLSRVCRQATMVDGAVNLIQQLHQQGFKLALVAGRTQPELLAELYRFDLGQYFSVISGTDKHRIKPDPAILLNIMNRMGSKPDSTLMIGASLLDMEMAVLADVPRVGAVYANPGYSEADVLMFRRWHPVAIATSLSHLSQLLLQSAPC